MEKLQRALAGMGTGGTVTEILQQKDGVTVARVMTDDGPRVLKTFEKAEFAREIENYRLLGELGVPALRVYGVTETALLLEDIRESRWRLGREEDLHDPEVARLLAGWYRALHQAGEGYLRENPGAKFYDEYELVTPETLAMVQQKTGTGALPVWRYLEENFGRIEEAARQLGRTLAYNDFYYVNFAVARDKSAALMFDYNLLGKGTRYADVRNVLYSLSEEAGEAFREAYGFVPDPAEEAADEVMAVLSTLVLAARRERFPGWAEEALAALREGFEEKVERMIGGY